MFLNQESAEKDGVWLEKRGALGLITLNRPQALNALNEAMVDAISQALIAFEEDETILHVAIQGAGGKAFCAGGDIRLMHDLGRAQKHEEALRFWAKEYQLNRQIKRYSKPYIALWNGIVMGGGVGVSLHGTHRFAGANLLFAMPEVGIGFFPDVGASYALARLPAKWGAYLALTGARLRRAEALFLGLATHAVRGGCENEIIEALAAGDSADEVAARFYEEESAPPPFFRTRKADCRYFCR